MFCSREDSVKVQPGVDKLFKKVKSKLTGIVGSGKKEVGYHVGEAIDDVPVFNLKNMTTEMWFLLLLLVVVVMSVCKSKYTESKDKTGKLGSYYY